MTRKETLKEGVKILSNVNKRSIARDNGIVYNYCVNEANLTITIKSGMLFKPEADNINYLYIEKANNELTLQF